MSDSTNVKGDVNDSGQVTPADFKLLGEYLVDSSVEINLDNADMNNDGNVNMRDYSALQKYLLEHNDIHFAVEKTSDFISHETYDTHTFTIVNQSGTIAENMTDVDQEQTGSLYLGATKLTDIVVMNDIPGLETQYNISIENNILVGVPNNFSTALGNPNKLYVWYTNSDYAIFVYNPKNRQYMQLGSSVSGGGGTTTTDNSINYVSSAADVGDPSKYVSKTWVYYPQT